MRIRNRLKVRQLATLIKPDVYSDGGGLYLRVRDGGSGSWLNIYSFNNKRRETGLGSDLEVTLANAREKAGEARLLVFTAKIHQPLKRMDRPDITVHGFRSTFRDWAGETTQFRREEIEMALAHTIASGTEHACRRGRALDTAIGEVISRTTVLMCRASSAPGSSISEP